MAEKAAHLTSNLQIKPSIFEVVAADSLNSTFYPALKRVVNFLALRRPDKFSFLIKYYDEVYLVLNGIVQNYYLKNNGGSLSEVFYSLCRFSLKSKEFNKQERYISLFCIVLLPYIRQKFDDIIAKWKCDLQDNPQIDAQKFKKIIVNSYNFLLSIYECLKVAQYIAYLANKSQCHSPILTISNIGLQYIQPEEYQEWSWSDIFGGKIRLASILSGTLLRGLEVSAFFLQFLQWWQNEAQHADLTSLPTPDPPIPDANAERYQGLCPICLQKWKIPTAVSLSGYVYCYKCIVTYLHKKGSCPVTNYPISIDDLIHIYESSD